MLKTETALRFVNVPVHGCGFFFFFLGGGSMELPVDLSEDKEKGLKLISRKYMWVRSGLFLCHVSFAPKSLSDHMLQPLLLFGSL